MKRGTKLKNRNMCIFTGNGLPEHKTVLHVFGKHILHVLANLLS